MTLMQRAGLARADLDKMGIDQIFRRLETVWDDGGRAVAVEVACRAAERVMVGAWVGHAPMIRQCVDAARAAVSDRSEGSLERCEILAQESYRCKEHPIAYNVAKSAWTVNWQAVEHVEFAAWLAACCVRGPERAAQRRDLIESLCRAGEE